MAYNIKVKFNGDWIWMIDGFNHDGEPERAVFETYDQARDLMQDAKPGYFNIIEV